MCREFAIQHFWNEIRQHFGVNEGSIAFEPNYGLRAGNSIPTIHASGSASTRLAQSMKWGLVPNWANEEQATRRLFNARAETLAEKRAFRESLLTRRCIVPASGFFEYTTQDGERVPLYAHERNGAPLGFAALWDEWVSPQGQPWRACTIVTTESNSLLAPHHARMPAILKPEHYAQWLDPQLVNPLHLRQVLQPFDARKLVLHSLAPGAMQRSSNDSLRIAPGDDVYEYNRGEVVQRKRLVMRDWVSPDHQVFFKTRSFTRDDYTYWHPVVDLENGHVWCDCPDFRFRHAMHEPDMHMPHHWCKHVTRAVENCRRHGELIAA